MQLNEVLARLLELGAQHAEFEGLGHDGPWNGAAILGSRQPPIDSHLIESMV